MRLICLTIAALAIASVSLLPTAHAKILRMALSDDATTPDPHAAGLATNHRLLSNIYEGLVRRDKDFKIAPALAVSWTQPAAKTWRFKLREGVKFHDGSAFTADDVVFSINRAMHPLSSVRYAAQGIASAKRVDDLTVDVSIAHPNPVMLLHLVHLAVISRPWSATHNVLLPQNYAKSQKTLASRSTNGTGHFMLALRAPGVKTVIVENKNWWNRQASDRCNVTAVEWTPIKSHGTRVAALMSGAVDFVSDPPVQDSERLKSVADVKLQLVNEPRMVLLALDQKRDELLYNNVRRKNLFKDIWVRQAIALAIDANGYQ